jgi:hypothetical protein
MTRLVVLAISLLLPLAAQRAKDEGNVCPHDCKCLSMTRPTMDKAEDGCRLTYVPKGKKDKETQRLLSECLQKTPTHCQLINEADHRVAGHCTPHCKAHTCRCEDGPGCKVGETVVPDSQ